MKNNSYAFIFLTLIILFSNCRQKVKIVFYNETNFHLDSLILGGKFIGSVPSHGTIEFQKDSVEFDSGMFNEKASCVINGKKITTDHYGDICGTEMYVKRSGHFQQDIYIENYGKENFIYFKSHP